MVIYTRAQQSSAVYWRNLDRFCVVKLSHAATATGFCTTGKCIASLLAFIYLFIACDVKKDLKWGGSAPLSEKWEGTSPPCPTISDATVELALSFALSILLAERRRDRLSDHVTLWFTRARTARKHLFPNSTVKPLAKLCRGTEFRNKFNIMPYMRIEIL